MRSKTADRFPERYSIIMFGVEAVKSKTPNED